MKTIALFAFSLVWTTTQLFSQKNLPISIQPYAENWTYTLVKSMHRIGFDMPTMPATRPVSSVNPRTVLQLDSVKTFYAYNGTSDSMPFSRTVYQNLPPDVKIETDYRYDNGEWLALHRSTLSHDGQQRLVEISTDVFDADSKVFRPDSRVEIFPHEHSSELTDSILAYRWDASTMYWRRIFSINYTFDAQDRLLETISHLDDLGNQGTYKSQYYYDAVGDNYMIREFEVLNNQDQFSGRTDIQYVDHRPIEVLNWIVVDSLDFRPKSRSNHAYTLFGAIRITNHFQYDEATETWRLHQKVTYLYDQSQRLASKQTDTDYLNVDGTRELYLYAYAEGNSLARETLFYWNEDKFDWDLDSRKYYYYNGLVSTPRPPQSVQNLNVMPNPSTGVIQLQLKQEALVRVFDARGQLVLSQIIESGQSSMNLTQLPAGTYTLTTQQGKDLFISKVVKL